MLVEDMLCSDSIPVSGLKSTKCILLKTKKKCYSKEKEMDVFTILNDWLSVIFYFF